MKKGWKILIIGFTLFFIVPYYVFAIQGACSYHNGVNCSAGADWDGSVICNDGWRDSSVNYYNTTECQSFNEYSIPCIYPSSFNYDYTDEQQCSIERAMCARSGFSGVCKTRVERCKQQVAEYQQKLKEYDECIANWKNQKIDEIADKYIEAERLERQNNALKLLLYCAQIYGSHSYYDESLGSCKCEEDYKLFDGKCKNSWYICLITLGGNADYSESLDRCICKTGYELKENPLRCEEIPVKPIEPVKPILESKPEPEIISEPKPEPEQKLEQVEIKIKPEIELKPLETKIQEIPESKKKLEKETIKIEPKKISVGLSEKSEILNNQQENKVIKEQPVTYPKQSFFKNLLSSITLFFSNLFKLLF